MHTHNSRNVSDTKSYPKDDCAGKEKEYRDLIEEAKARYDTKNGTVEGNQLIWCDDCEEINLWTYWQGCGNVSTCRILLVGQDWGSIGEDCCAAGLENARRINNGEDLEYMHDNRSVTNENLIKLFNVLGYDISKSHDEKNKELFFTNLCLGYRQKKTSGNLPTKQLFRDIDLFRKLTEILEPEAIICLGNQTLTGVMRCFANEPVPKLGAFNEAIKNNKNCFSRGLSNGSSVKIFVVAHPGQMGTMNRNKTLNPDWHKGCDRLIKKFYTSTDLEKQKDDWKWIKEQLTSSLE